MGLPRKLKIAIWAALGVMALGIIAGFAVFALTLIRDATENTPAAIVGETAGAVVEPVQTVGAVAPSPLDAVGAEADEKQRNPDPMHTPTATPTPTPIPTEAPGSPGSVSASFTGCSSPRSCGVTVSWSAPSSGGAPNSYEAQLRDSAESGSLDSTTTSHSFTVRYGYYKAEVRAVNQVGASDWASVDILVANPPDAIASISVSRSDGALALSWTVPHDGGSSIQSYEAECSADNGTSWSSCASNIAASGSEGSAFTATITGVDNSSAYAVRARAVNAAGKSGWTKSANIPAPTPGAASNVSAARDGFSVSASWDAATYATSYDVELRVWTFFGTTVEQTQTGATGTTATFTVSDFADSHIVQVTAKNSSGSGDAASSSVAHPPDAPAQPSSVTGDRSTDGATISASWSGADGATGYDLRYKTSGGQWQTHSTHTANTSASITGLDKTKAYVISVRAVKKYVGSSTVTLNGDWKNSATIHAWPGKATNISASGYLHSDTTIRWTRPSFIGTGSGLKYNVYCRTYGDNPWVKVKSNVSDTSDGNVEVSVSDNNCNVHSAEVAVAAVNGVEGEKSVYARGALQINPGGGG